jgi:uncharacterized protein
MQRASRAGLGVALLGAMLASCGSGPEAEPPPSPQDPGQASPPPAAPSVRLTLGIVARPLRGTVSEADLRALGLPDDSGLYLAHVHEQGPGMKAGLQREDVLLLLAGRPLDSLAALDAALASHAEGDSVAVELWRGRARLETTARLEGAAAVFQRACEQGDAEGCFSMGTMLAQHEEVGQNRAWALEFIKKGCDRGSADACLRLARALEQGELGSAPNPLRAAGLYEKVCQQDVPAACVGLARIYGQPGGALESQERAATLYQRACGWRDPEACHEIAQRYELGNGVPQDAQRALSLHRVACDLGHQGSCARLTGSR